MSIYTKMSKLSQTVQRLLKLHNNHHYFSTSKPSFRSNSSLSSRLGASLIAKPSLSAPFFASKPAYPNVGGQVRVPYQQTHARKLSLLYGVRQFSIRSGNSGSGGDFLKRVFERPVVVVSSAFARYKEAIGLHTDAFCRRNYLMLFGVGGVLVCAVLWRIMFGIADSVIGISEGMAKYGFLALSTAIVAFAGLYIRSRFVINPDRVYRMTMRKLNTSAGILEVMGAPLTGTELRAYVTSGGGPTLKNFKPSIRSKRCFLIFPIRGSERKGLVSVEVKKKKGQYDMKLLAVDIPMASGPDHRIYLIGDENEYKVGGGLISELRDPVVKAMAASKEFDILDEIEEEEDAARELEEAGRKQREEIENIEKEYERKQAEETEKLQKGGT